jgi:hypothetical protein
VEKLQEMRLKIQNIMQALNLQKPTTVTNSRKIDMLIEKDLRGLNLYDITDEKIIRRLSGDLTIFNDDAFRYYTLQFMDYYFLSYEYLFLTLFVPAYKRTDKFLGIHTNRFLQFEKKEVGAIVDFFHFLSNETEILQKKFKNINFDIQKPSLDASNSIEIQLEYHYLDLIDCKQDIKDVLFFWKKHPKFKGFR